MNGSWYSSLRYRWALLNMAERLIAIQVVIFIIFQLIQITFFISNSSNLDPKGYFALPANLDILLWQPWSVLTYSFLHSSLWHLLWNMLMLYFTSRIFFNLFSSSLFLTIYFGGVLLGGIAFLLAFNLLSVFEGKQYSIIGASAGVMAVLLFLCAYVPQHRVMIFFIKLKLWHIGAILVLLDILLLPDNSGGHIAHLGGAVWGFLYGRRLIKGYDLGGWMDSLVNKTNKHNKSNTKNKSRLRTVHRAKTTTPSARFSSPHQEEVQKRIDTILDKISKSSYDSLSKEEKDFLFRVGKED